MSAEKSVLPQELFKFGSRQSAQSIRSNKYYISLNLHSTTVASVM